MYALQLDRADIYTVWDITSDEIKEHKIVFEGTLSECIFYMRQN